MRKKLNTGWIVLIFGLLMLAVVVGSLLRAADLGEGTPTAWHEPIIATMHSEPATDTPGWWDAKDTQPPWPTDHLETHATAEE